MRGNYNIILSRSFFSSSSSAPPLFWCLLTDQKKNEDQQKLKGNIFLKSFFDWTHSFLLFGTYWPWRRKMKEGWRINGGWGGEDRREGGEMRVKGSFLDSFGHCTQLLYYGKDEQLKKNISLRRCRGGGVGRWREGERRMGGEMWK